MYNILSYTGYDKQLITYSLTYVDKKFHKNRGSRFGGYKHENFYEYIRKN